MSLIGNLYHHDSPRHFIYKTISHMRIFNEEKINDMCTPHVIRTKLQNLAWLSSKLSPQTR